MRDDDNTEQPSLAAKPPRSKLRIALLASPWILLVLVGVIIFSPLRDMALNHFFPPSITPTPALTVGDNLFYIQAAPQGTVTIDGRPVTQLPPVGSPSPIRLSRGLHKIAWQAAPFNPLSCIVTVPAVITGEQCMYETPIQFNNTANARLISFFASISDLSTPQKNALTHSIQTTLDGLQSTTTVQPGELYYDAQSSQPNSLVTATEPLKVTLSYQLDANPNSNYSCSNYQETICQVNGQNCLELCTIPTPPANAVTTQPSWNLLALYHPLWTYTTLDGRAVAQSQHDPFGYNGQEYDYSAYFHVSWDGSSWHSSILSHAPPAQNLWLVEAIQQLPAAIDPSCAAPDDGTFGLYTTTTGNPHANVSWTFYPASNRANGCLGVVTQDTNPAAPPAYYLFRFGAILTGNAVAHNYFPSLPVADATAQGIAQQVIAANHLH